MSSPHDAPRPADEHIRATVFVRGVVQGVGFRWWTRARALELSLTGWAWLLHLLAEQPSTRRRPGHVDLVSTPLLSDPKGERGFVER